MRYITNNQGLKIAIGDSSAYALAALPAMQGRISEKAIRELLKGNKTESKGFSIIEETQATRPVPKANKQGVECRGKGQLRKRLPMLVYIQLTKKGQGYAAHSSGDFNRFLYAIPSSCGVEYQDVANTLGWSRDLISILSAKAYRLGLITKRRESNPVHIQQCQQI